MRRLSFCVSEKSLDAVRNILSIIGHSNCEVDVVCLTEIFQPLKKLCDCIGRRVVQKLIEVIYKNVGYVIVTCVQTADKATEETV